MSISEGDAKAALRKAATVIQTLERRLQAAEAAKHEPIAIVGAGCRLPGGVTSVAELGALGRAGGDAIGPIPATRFDADAIYDPDPEAPGKCYARHGAFLDDVAGFDADFFGISPREAAWLDPQHRLVLECAWEALEDAGVATDRLRNAPVGVFVGIGPSDYAKRLTTHAHRALSAYTATGSAVSFSAGRLSFLLGVQGPSLAVDTACSSSLVALHLACQSLRAGECQLALAGGVQVMLSAESFLVLARLRALAPDGRCKSFSAEANGYGRGEGCGIVALKRLSQAERDRDRVLAVIRGSAINHDGPASALIAPNGLAQRDVLARALANAGLSAAEIDYVEAHGTGTPLGDPIEVNALADVYGARERPLAIGTVKSNIGHLESASGVAGVLKVVAALADGVLPPSLHADELSREVDWDHLPLRLVRAAEPWPAGERRRRAGVSSFGMSGTNAHVLLEEAPPPATARATAAARPAELVVLSARSPAGLDAAAARLGERLAAAPDLALGDLAYSLATARAHHPYRLALVAGSTAALAEALATVAAGELPAAATRGDGRTRRGKLAFLFTGQGAQRLGMGRGLYAAWPAFREAWDRVAALLDGELPRPLAEVVWAEPGSPAAALLDQTGYTQTALFALEVALAALWRSWGVEPELVAGHSIGELAAAHVAGVFALEDAVKLVGARARLMQALPSGGAMLAVAAGEAAVAPFLNARVALAAVNGPEAVVLSGPEADVLAAGEALAARGVRTKRLTVSHAFHSPLMEPMLAEFARVAAGLRYRAPERPIVSNLTGALAGAEVASPDYWVRHVREAVRFGAGVQALGRAGAATFVEIGPRPTLLALVPACLGDAEVALVPSLRAPGNGADGGAPAPGDWEPAAALAALGACYARGGSVDWGGLFPDGGRRVELPRYAWQRERHWEELMQPGAALPTAGGRWPLSGVELRVPGSDWHHVLAMSPEQPSFVGHHVVFDKVVLAGAYHTSVLLAVAAEHWPGRAIEIEGLEFPRARSLDAGEEIELHAILTPSGDGETRRFELLSPATDGGSGEGAYEERRWVVHARGRVRPVDARPRLPRPEALEERMPERLEREPVFARLSALHIEWGPRWRWFDHGRFGADASMVTLAPTYDGAHAQAPLHPGLLDNAFSVSVLASLAADMDSSTPRLPFAIDRLRWWRAPSGRVRVAGVLHPGAADVTDFVLVDEDGNVAAEVEGYACMAAPRDRFLRGAEATAAAGAASAPRLGDDDYLALEWPVAPLPPPRAQDGRWLLVGDGEGMAPALAAALTQAGQRVARVAGLVDDGALVAAFGGEAPTAVVHLGSLTAAAAAPANAAPSADAVEAALVHGCDSVLALVQALARAAFRAPPRLWLVTRAAQAAGQEAIAAAQAPLIGLGRVLALEHAELRCARVDLDAARSAGEAATLAAELLADDGEEEIAWRGGERRVARLGRRRPEAEAEADERREPAAGRPYRLEMDEAGVLDRLTPRLIERRPPGPGEVEIAVEAAGLNFLEVLLALGVMPNDTPRTRGLPLAPGAEHAGRIVAVGAGVSGLAVGQPVVALAERGAFGTHVTMAATLVLPAPAGLTPAELAALPVGALTAWYSLERVARLSRGERVLIHAATGGVGVAAVQWAQHVGAEIYATAGSDDKRAWLRAQGVRYVSDSRSDRFVADVREWTGGEGVDVVLNSLADDLIAKSFDLLRPYGRFVEIGKRDYYANRPLGLRPFLRSLSFALVDLRHMLVERPAWLRGLFEELLGHVAAGVIKPPPITEVPMGRLVDAFAAMSRGQHLGKLVGVADAAAEVSPRPPAPVIRADGSYVITGGLGGLGLSVADWLSERGAGHLVLLGRAGLTTPAQEAAVAALRARGTRVTVARADVAARADLERVLAAVRAEGPPLRGIVHAAGLVDDGLVVQQTPERLRRVMAPKIAGALHLHELTQGDPLDLFVLYSSASSLLGSAGQGNYAAANAFLDALAQLRRRNGQPGLSINWGAFAEVGMAAAADNRGARMEARGLRSLRPDEGLEALARLVRSGVAGAGVMPLDARKWVEFYPAAAASRMLAPLVGARAAAPAAGGDFAARLHAAAPGERAALVRGLVRAQVARVLRMPEAKLDDEAPFTRLGMDSLTGLELRNRLGGALGQQLPATLVFQHPTIAAVTAFLLDTLVRAALTDQAAPLDEEMEEEGRL